MRHKNLRSVSRVRRDYDQDMDNYDRIRFGTPGGQYVDKKEQEFVASVIKDSRVLEVGIATLEQYYCKISDVKGMFLRAGFTVAKSGSVMRIPVTVYRRCPRLFVPLLGQLEKLWCWPMHGYVLGSK